MPGYCPGHPDDLSSRTIYLIDAIVGATICLHHVFALKIRGDKDLNINTSLTYP